MWFASWLMYAQNAGMTPTLYDMVPFTNEELSGTARYVGMGGAMNALGGDISTMGKNPAGIGLYRRNDVAVTGGVAVTNHDMGTFGNEKETYPTFKQVGFVYSNRVDGISLKYFNLGFNYHRLKDFRGKARWSSNMPTYNNGAASLSMVIEDMTYGLPYQLAKGNSGSDFNTIVNAADASGIYQNNTDVGWLSVMGIRTRVIDGIEVKDNSGNPVLDDYGNTVGDYVGFNGLKGDYYRETRGGVDAYDFNMAFNINDRFYLGATLTALDVDYEYYTAYAETVGDPLSDKPFENVGSFTLENWKKTTGNGFNVKLGMIVRPVEESPFRIGFAVETPTWYRLTDSFQARMTSVLEKQRSENVGMDYDYKYQTPWNFNVSLGHTVGNFLALDAEYEYTDYSSAKLKDVDGNNADENDYIKAQMKGLSQFKIGAELKPADDFAVRVGFNYLTASMKTGEAYYYSPGITAVNTRTDFANMKDGYNVSFGLGYAGKHFYADFAYLFSTRNYDFYPFAVSDIENGNYTGMNTTMPATSGKMNRHQAMLTLGFRF